MPRVVRIIAGYFRFGGDIGQELGNRRPAFGNPRHFGDLGCGDRRVDVVEAGLEIAAMVLRLIAEPFLEYFFVKRGALLGDEPAEVVRVQLGFVDNEPVNVGKVRVIAV